MRWGIIGIVVLLCGCESMPRGEWAYQTVLAVDVAQTINGPVEDTACYVENDSLTRRIIGREPSRGKVLAWGLAKSVGHYGVSKYLDSNAPSWALPVWQLISTGNAALTVNSNFDIGIKPWGDNDHSKLPKNDRCYPG